jgi:Beta-lactamase superfamily domain
MIRVKLYSAFSRILCCSVCIISTSSFGYSDTNESDALFQAGNYLKSHQANGYNAERRKRLDIIQSSADKLTHERYKQYMQSWGKENISSESFEHDPLLVYLNKSWDEAVADIRKTKVEKGVAVWYMYNMGYVFKTFDACFAVDLKFKGAERLADELDFLLVTHKHDDHRNDTLIKEMINHNKKVVTSFFKGSRIIEADKWNNLPEKKREIKIKNIRIKIDIGDHHYNDPNERDNMLMFQIDCSTSDGMITIYHSGDGSNIEKIKPDKPVTIFIPHIAVGLPIEKTIQKIKPELTLLSHILELSHSNTPPNASRWSFNAAFSKVKNIKNESYCIMTWGERYLLPGSVVR